MEAPATQPYLINRGCLLVVDALRGFTTLCPDELPIPGGLEIVAPINRLLELPWARVDAAQDWHPPDHCSFLPQGGNYPPHYVMGSNGAEFLPRLRTERFQRIWRKGFCKDRDALSLLLQYPGYAALLRLEVEAVFVCGLALNICCHLTALDLRMHGLQVFLIEDASAGIDVPQAGFYQANARAEAAQTGMSYVRIADLISAHRGHAGLG
jgi:nicotinamidase/pyrazinamidase